MGMVETTETSVIVEVKVSREPTEYLEYLEKPGMEGLRTIEADYRRPLQRRFLPLNVTAVHAK